MRRLHVLSMDTRQAMPHGFEKSDLEATATTFDWSSGRFVLRDPVLAHFPVRMETPPRANDFAEIVRKTGTAVEGRAARIEVAFERIVPKNGQLMAPGQPRRSLNPARPRGAAAHQAAASQPGPRDVAARDDRRQDGLR